MLNANINWEGSTELLPFWLEDSTKKARTAEGNIGMRRGKKGQKSIEEYRIKIKQYTNNNNKNTLYKAQMSIWMCAVGEYFAYTVC